MKTIYEKAGPLIVELVKNVMATYHPELAVLAPVVAVMFVRKLDEDDNPYHALKHHGAAAAAVIKAVSTKKRVLVDFDLELDLDGMTWDAIKHEERIALIDHELNHVVIIRDTHNAPKQDDLGNYKYRLRPDDYVLTGFFAVAERHGDSAIEAQAVKRINDRMLVALQTAAAATAAATAAAA